MSSSNSTHLAAEAGSDSDDSDERWDDWEEGDEDAVPVRLLLSTGTAPSVQAALQDARAQGVDLLGLRQQHGASCAVLPSIVCLNGSRSGTWGVCRPGLLRLRAACEPGEASHCGGAC